MFLRALLIGYVAGLLGTLLLAPAEREEEPTVAAAAQPQSQGDPEGRLSLLRFDLPAR
ncbi:hypothetical protein [Thermaurantiacus tibetensis]|uniref:hypothetical protein n=1 Tax=Thermaurantiacus tibetensis TaxID=2759035 RepID=UPI0018905DBE|nr:hypothetical protein [Thermaurantiacus tibetensis]